MIRPHHGAQRTFRCKHERSAPVSVEDQVHHQLHERQLGGQWLQLQLNVSESHRSRSQLGSQFQDIGGNNTCLRLTSMIQSSV